MSDQTRLGFSDKAASALKPDSEKSTAEHAGDKIKGTADDMLSKVQPENKKSSGQKVGDAVSVDQGDDTSLMDKAKNAVGLGDRNTK